MRFGHFPGNDLAQFIVHVQDRHAIGNQFFHHFPVCNQVDQRNVLHLQNHPAQKRNQFAARNVITDHLRHTEQSRFQGSGSRCHQSSLCMVQQTVSLSENHFDLLPHVSPVKGFIESRALLPQAGTERICLPPPPYGPDCL